MHMLESTVFINDKSIVTNYIQKHFTRTPKYINIYD